MWIVRLALRRPYTFVVLAIGLLAGGIAAALRMPTDIFPAIEIPVITVVWQYSGMAPEEMERRIVTNSERFYTTVVNGIEHIESQTVNGISLIKLFFHPGADIAAAAAQLASASQAQLRNLPPGTIPPIILRFNATDVPIMQVSIGAEPGATKSEQELWDYGANTMRTQLQTVRGAATSQPFGGRTRQVMVDIDPARLYGFGLSPVDVSNAINAQNVLLPAGTARMGDREYNVRLNSSPDAIAALNDVPIRTVNGRVIYMRDVAQVRDGGAVQTNIIRNNGQRGTVLTVLKTGGASTLDVVGRARALLASLEPTHPAGTNVAVLADQSVFVRAALKGTVIEAVIAATLTALMILLFLGSWRSTLIIATTIPLSIFSSIIGLAALGETLNVMTLGGLALAVGILVDDATVAIENIHRNIEEGKPLDQAILDGAQQIAVPTLVATLAICIVFVPVFFLSGTARFLFAPMALAVILAMLASYVLSRTLLPTMVKFLLRDEAHAHGTGATGAKGGFDRAFERFTAEYRSALEWTLAHRGLVGGAFVAFCVLSVALLGPFVGQDFFPHVDTGRFILHVRAPVGTRIESTEALVARVEAVVRRVIPRRELSLILSNIGVNSNGLNLATSSVASVGPSDAEVLVTLDEADHGPTATYQRALRETLAREIPEATFFYQPADIISQVLNFGLPSAIDVQIVGRNRDAAYSTAKTIADKVKRIPGASDVHVHQIMNVPEIRYTVDRELAQAVGLNQRDVASNLLISLSSSGQTAPNFWLNPQNGVQYPVMVQTPQYSMGTMEELANTPVMASGFAQPQLFGNLARATRGTTAGVVNHYNVTPVANVYASADGRDLGSVAAEVDRIIDDARKELPPGMSIVMRGQVASMRQSFIGLGLGILFAIALVYLLMVVNFQSWTDPLVIVTALPGALAGIVWMLFVTGTTISVPALMGAVMAMGVATANSILIVSFANDQRERYAPAASALMAGVVRLRPVLMTAGAMIIGMLPMALGFGEGGEQNAPLGRAVIGGLIVATLATLFFVPLVYSTVHERRGVAAARRSASRSDAPGDIAVDLPIGGVAA